MAPGPAREPVGKVTEEARVRLGDKVFEEAWAAGRDLAPQTAIAESLAPVQAPPNGRLRGAGVDNPLTQREMEVAELVACGMTNREIARRLGIAEWTAVNHLRKIMRKLDCSSRVHVAGWMTKRQGPPVQPGARAMGREHRGR
jgi:DNA-binding CsgD family transcriptional regulator